MKELEDVKQDVDSKIVLAMVNDSDISHIKGTFQGPPGTPYEGGEFIVDIKIPVSFATCTTYHAANRNAMCSKSIHSSLQ